MTRRCMSFLALVLALLAVGCAQPRAPEDEAERAQAALAAVKAPSDMPFAPWLQGERERVTRERGTAQQRYQDDELACWHRFAVNDCLRDAKQQRRATLDGLRQQEIGLNALERERRTAERLRAIERKAPSDP